MKVIILDTENTRNLILDLFNANFTEFEVRSWSSTTKDKFVSEQADLCVVHLSTPEADKIFGPWEYKGKAIIYSGSISSVTHVGYRRYYYPEEIFKSKFTEIIKEVLSI